MVRNMQEIGRRGRDTGIRKRFTWAMVVSCQGCGHRLWAEEVPVADRFGAWASFDDEERSGTYAERVEWCPECGAWLNTHALLTADGKRLRGGAEL